MMKNRFLVALSLVALSASLAGAGAKNDDNAAAAFAKLKTLVGQWEADTDKGKITATYELVSNDTALVEHVNVPGEDAMLTVYHLDGSHLVLTHYCSAGNQPHMQAKAFDPASNTIRFDFLSAGNLASAGDGHMHSVQVSFIGPDAFKSDWTFYKDGKPAFSEGFQFRRVR
jgi:hypothetical protein